MKYHNIHPNVPLLAHSNLQSKVRPYYAFIFSLLVLLGIGAKGYGQQLSLYISAPGVQTAEDSGLSVGDGFSTENFNSLGTGALADGTLSFGGSSTAAHGGVYTISGDVSIIGSNQYGGFQQGNYVSVSGLNATMTIQFQAGINYFGFLWTAGDATNKLSFYNEHNQLLATYSTEHLLSILPRNNTSLITAVDGSQYYTGNYYGQPTAEGPIAGLPPDDELQPTRSLNMDEPYGYLHFIDELSSNAIHSIVIEKSLTGGNFENDNHSISLESPETFDTPVVLIQSAIPVPEPSGALLVLASGMGALALSRRRKH